MDRRAPERFGGVDVADPSDEALIEQRRFDRSAFFAQRVPKGRDGEGWIISFRTEIENRRPGFRVIPHRAERSGIGQRGAKSVGELERDAGEARQFVGRARKDPVAVHAKVRVERCAVYEVNELVLAAAFHRGDVLPFGALRRRPRELAALRRVMGFETRERLSFDRRSEARCGFVNFGEFGHRSNFASFAELNNASDGHGYGNSNSNNGRRLLGNARIRQEQTGKTALAKKVVSPLLDLAVSARHRVICGRRCRSLPLSASIRRVVRLSRSGTIDLPPPTCDSA
jgi:hypothetical protein